MTPIAEGMLLDFDVWLGKQDAETREGINQHLAAVPEGERPLAKQRLASIAAVSEAENIDIEEVSDRWNVIRDGYAERRGGNWLATKGNETAFNSKLKEEAAKRQNERWLLQGMDDDKDAKAKDSWETSLVNRSREAAYSGKDFVQTFGEWQEAAKSKPGYDSARADAYVNLAGIEWRRMNDALAKVRPVANEAFERIAQAREVIPDKGTGTSDDSPFALMRGLSAEEKRLAFRLMADRAGNGPDKSDWMGLSQASGEALGRGFENLALGGGAAAWRSRLLRERFTEGTEVRADNAADEVRGKFFAEMSSRSGANSATPEFFTRPTRKLTAAEAEKWNAEIERVREDLDTAEELRRFGQDVIDPTNKSGSWARRTFWLPAMDSAAVMSTLAIPGAWAPALELGARSYQNEEYQRLRSQFPDMKPVEADRLALVTGAAQSALDKLELGVFKSGFTATRRGLERFALSGPYAARLGFNILTTAGAESLIEKMQDNIIPAMVQDNFASDPKFDVHWGEVWTEVARSLPETFFGMLLLSGLGGIVQTNGQSAFVRELSSSAAAMRARGYSLEQIGEIQSAPANERGELLARYLPTTAPTGKERETLISEAVKLASEEREAFAEKQRGEAVAGSEAADYAIRLTRRGSGWWVQFGDKSVQVDSVEAARRVREDLKQAATQNEAEALIAIIDDWHSKAPKSTSRETTLTGETARSDGQSITYTRDGKVTREVTSAEDLATLREEAQMDARFDGTEEIDVAVNGSNVVEFGEKVANGARSLVQRLEINQSDSAVLTFLHESAEADWRAGLANGSVTVEETQRAIASLASAFDPAKARDAEEKAFRERVQKVARGEASQTELRETLSELAVADVLGKRRDGSAMPAGSVTAALNQAALLATDSKTVREIGKLRAFVRAVRQYFRALLGTVAAVKKARREGGAAEFDALIDKIAGRDAQGEHDQAAADEAEAIASQSDLDYNPPSEDDIAAGVAFSVSRADIRSRLQESGVQANELDRATGETQQRLRTAVREDELFDWARRSAESGGLPGDRDARELSRERAENSAIGDPLNADISGALAARGRVSSLIHGMLTRQIPGFNIEGSEIRSTGDFVRLLLPLRSPYFESLKVAFVDADKRVIHSQILHVGSLNESIAHPRDLLTSLQEARRKNPNVAGVVIAHNHPSGDPTPSTADERLTERIKETVAMAGIDLLDHVITNGQSYHSFTAGKTVTIDGAKLADWEVVHRKQLARATPEVFEALIANLRQHVTPETLHLVYLTTKHTVSAVERTAPGSLTRALLDGVGREAPFGVMLDASGLSDQNAYPLIQRMLKTAGLASVKLLDVATKGSPSWAREGKLSKGYRLTAGSRLELIQKRLDSALSRDPERRRSIHRTAADSLQRLQFEWETERETWKGDRIRPLVDRRTPSELNKEQAMRQALRADELIGEGMSRLTPETLQAYEQGVDKMEDDPLVTVLLENGKLMSRTEALRRGRQSEYDGVPWLPPRWYGGNLMPDETAQFLHDAGLLRDPSPDALWVALGKVIESNRKQRAAFEDASKAVLEIEEAAWAKAREEAALWREEQEEMQRKDWSPRARLVRDLRTLDAILSVLPPEVRGKVGGFVKLAQLGTDKARVEEISRRIEKMSGLLEKHLQAETTSAMRELLERAEPSREAGKQSRGKIGAQAHRFLDACAGVMDLTTEQVEQRRAAIQAGYAEPTLTSEQAADLFEQEQILDTFGAWDQKTAADMDAALRSAQAVFETGRNRWRTIEEARLERVSQMAADVVAALGGESYTGIQSQKQENGALLRAAGKLSLDLKSFREVLQALLGRDSELARRWTREARDGFARRNDEVRDVRARWRAAVEAATGERGLAAQRALWDLAHEQTLTVQTAGRLSTQSESVPISTIDRWKDGTAQPDALGFSADEADDLIAQREAMTDDDRRESLPFSRSSRSTEETVPMTEAEGIFVTMLAHQVQYLEALNRAGFTTEVVESIEDQLSEPGKRLRAWMREQYRDNYGPLAAVFESMYGVALPQIRNYAPAAFYHQGAEHDSGPEERGGIAQGMRAGFLRNRKQHTAAPRLENAFATFHGHATQTAHWKALAPFVRDLSGVFAKPQVKAAVEARYGREMMQVLTQWIHNIEGNGLQSQSGMIDRAVSRFTSSQAYVALAFRLGTLAKQSTALLGAAYRMPIAAYARGFARLVSGQLDVATVFNSPVIQRRLETGFAPEVRAALNDVWSQKPSRRAEILARGMELIGLTDAIFTTGSAAIAYDYHYRQALAAGLEEESARIAAMRETEDVVNSTAQPADAIERSLFEARQNAFGRLLFLFASEARQKSSLWLTAWQNTLTGQATSDDYRVLAISHLVVAPMLQAITAAWRDIRDDDDDELFDTQHWAPTDFLKAMVAGPLSGIPLVNEALSGFPDNGIFGRQLYALKSLGQLFTGPKEGEAEKVEWYMDRIFRVMQGADAFTAVAGGVADQVFSIIDDLTPDTEAEAARKQRRREAREQKETREANQ